MGSWARVAALAAAAVTAASAAIVWPQVDTGIYEGTFHAPVSEWLVCLLLAALSPALLSRGVHPLPVSTLIAAGALFYLPDFAASAYASAKAANLTLGLVWARYPQPTQREFETGYLLLCAALPLAAAPFLLVRPDPSWKEGPRSVRALALLSFGVCLALFVAGFVLTTDKAGVSDLNYGTAPNATDVDSMVVVALLLLTFVVGLLTRAETASWSGLAALAGATASCDMAVLAGKAGGASTAICELVPDALMCDMFRNSERGYVVLSVACALVSVAVVAVAIVGGRPGGASRDGREVRLAALAALPLAGAAALAFVSTTQVRSEPLYDPYRNSNYVGSSFLSAAAVLVFVGRAAGGSVGSACLAAAIGVALGVTTYAAEALGLPWIYNDHELPVKAGDCSAPLGPAAVWVGCIWIVVVLPCDVRQVLASARSNGVAIASLLTAVLCWALAVPLVALAYSDDAEARLDGSEQYLLAAEPLGVMGHVAIAAVLTAGGVCPESSRPFRAVAVFVQTLVAINCLAVLDSVANQWAQSSAEDSMPDAQHVFVFGLLAGIASCVVGVVAIVREGDWELDEDAHQWPSFLGQAGVPLL